MDSSHLVYVNGELKYEFLESINYDTASPAQACIQQLKEIAIYIPAVFIVSFGKEYVIDSRESYLIWVKNVFSPTGERYECDFSKYL